MSSPSLDRVRLLINTDRHALAEEELRGLLALEPERPEAHALLAVVLNRMDRHEEALKSAETAVHYAPFWASPHAIRSRIYQDIGKKKEARDAAEEAHRLDPEEPDHLALLAWLEVDDSKWEAGLRWAGEGLALQADHAGCHNARAHCLQMLNRHDEAEHSLKTTLQDQPENALTHANMGWQCLRRGKHDEAVGHFKESLRLEPGNDYARAGIIEALKARNILYRPILAYFNFMARLTPGQRWGVIIGALVLYNLLRSALLASDKLKPYAFAVMGLYLFFVLTSWTGRTIFNVLLWFHPLGRHALNDRERLASALCAGCFGLALVWLALAFTLPSGDLLIWAAVFPFLCLPISTASQAWVASKRKLGYGIAALYVTFAMGGVIAALLGKDGTPFFTVTVYGLVAFTWFGGLLLKD
jgi:tetratricopeptide (TPR) repeat protein